MKNIILLLTLCFPMFAFASENCSTTQSAEVAEEQLLISTDVPKHLEGATITVTTKDGRVSTVPAEKFKVVPRKQQFIVTKTKQSSETLCKADKERNRISLLAGKGPKEGLNTTRTANEVTVENKIGAIGGAQYQRLLTDKISVGAQIQTNESVLVNVGLDF